jgi:hypothetical protein
MIGQAATDTPTVGDIAGKPHFMGRTLDYRANFAIPVVNLSKNQAICRA